MNTNRINALQAMIRGIKTHINSPANQGTGYPEKMLARMEEHLQRAKDGEDQDISPAAYLGYTKSLDKES